MTDYKVSIGIKEVTIAADSEGEAIEQALVDLADKVAWTQATKVEPRRTGFRYEPPAREESE
jgi:hypothetical protein